MQALSNMYSTYVAPGLIELDKYKATLVTDTLADLRNIMKANCGSEKVKREFQIRATIAGGSALTVVASVALKTFAAMLGSTNLDRIGNFGFYTGTAVCLFSSVGMLFNLGASAFKFENSDSLK